MPERASKEEPLTFVAIDFEISGNYGPSACSIGMAKFHAGKLLEEYQSLIRPPSPDVKFTKVHGLRWRDLKDAPDFGQVWDEAKSFLSGASYLAAHNAPFDSRILRACCEYYDQPEPGLAFLCTLKGSRRALAIEAHNLKAVSDYFGFALNHHEAASDARNCGKILCKLLKMGLAPEDMLCG